MKQPRALIAEDEPRLREQLAERLTQVWPELELAATVGDGFDAVQALDRHQPNTLFLDIQMQSELLMRLSGIANQGSYLRWINASVGKVVKLITVDEVCYFQVVNVNAIANVERNVRGRVMVKRKQRKESLAVSDAYVHLFRQM